MTLRAPPPRDVVSALIVSAVAGVVFLAHGLEGVLTRDLAIYTYAGQRVADGSAPYVDLVNRSGPLSHLAPGIGIFLGRLVGLDDVIAVRVAFLVLSVAAVYVVHRTAHRMLGSAALAGATAMALVMIPAFLQYASRGPREKTLMLLLVLLALDSIARGRWLRTGVYISLATLTWQPAFFPAIAAALTMLALQRSGRARGLARLTVGGLVPLGLFCAWYAAIGHLQDFLDAFVLIHSRYTDQPGLRDGFLQKVETTITAYGVSFWVLLAGLLASLVAGTWAVSRMARAGTERTQRDDFLVALAAGTTTGLAWSVRAFNGWADLFFLFPFALAGLAVILKVASAVLARRLRRPPDLALPQVQRVLGATCGIAALALGLQFVAGHGSDRLVGQRARAERVFAALGPGATAQSIQAPAPLVLTRTTNPTRHQMFALGLDAYVDEVWPRGLDGFAQEIVQQRPTLLVVQGGFEPDWVVDVLERGYVDVGEDEDGRYTFFVREDLDPAVIAQVRTAAADQLQ